MYISKYSAAPITNYDRIEFLDILRGIAVLFIFVANAFFLSGYFFLTDVEKVNFSLPWLDDAVHYLMLVLVEGKFYSIFSMLFGMGFVVQYENVRKRQGNFNTFFIRRMAGLLLIGLLHLFNWMGDILTLYAILGFLLIPFKHVSNKSLLWLAAILIFMPVVNLLFMASSGNFYPLYFMNIVESWWASNGLPLRNWMGNGPSADPLFHLQTTDFATWFQINIYFPLIRLGMILMEGREFKVFACFLLGVYGGRQILHHKLLENRKKL